MGEMTENPLRMPDSGAIERLNAAKYVDLREISEPNKNVFNSLRIVVEEAVVNEAAVVARASWNWFSSMSYWNVRRLWAC